MNHSGIRPRNNKAAACPIGKTGSPPGLRVLSEDAASRSAPPSIVMPRARTDLVELLAGDSTLCVRRRPVATPTPQNAELRSGTSAAHIESQTESPPALTIDGDLVGVIGAWPGLPQSVRAAVLTMIRETPVGET